MRLRPILPAALLAVAASPALAEVSDKIPAPGGLWGWAAGFTLAALLLALWRPAAGLVVVPLAALHAWGGYAMVSDIHLGPAILHEQGEGYVRMVHQSSALGVIGPLVMVLLVATYRQRVAARRLD